MLTAAQAMLIDVISDRIVTLGLAIANAKTMSDEEATKEADYWRAEKNKEMERLRQH